MIVTFYGQSCLTVEPAGKTVLLDPFICHDERARYVDVSAFRAGRILGTHKHLDRVADAADFAGRPGAPVIASGWTRHRVAGVSARIRDF